MMNVKVTPLFLYHIQLKEIVTQFSIIIVSCQYCLALCNSILDAINLK